MYVAFCDGETSSALWTVLKNTVKLQGLKSVEYIFNDI